jgi:hypothetical protein
MSNRLLKISTLVTSGAGSVKYKPMIWFGVSTRHRKCLTIGGNVIKRLSSAFIAVSIVCSFNLSFANVAISQKGQMPYPTSPEVDETPGDTCGQADEYRYPERIAYCERAVDTKTKAEIIQKYDVKYGYKIRAMDRQKFKIDHFIPLCAGGSNERQNLWPQHESIYKVTDPLEPAICEKMAEGKLLQAEAIDLIRQAKQDLSRVKEILAKVQAL